MKALWLRAATPPSGPPTPPVDLVPPLLLALAFELERLLRLQSALATCNRFAIHRATILKQGGTRSLSRASAGAKCLAERRAAQSQPRCGSRCQFTSLGNHSVRIGDMSRFTSAESHFGHGGGRGRRGRGGP